MYTLQPNSQRDWDFVDALLYLINIYLYNSNAAFIPVVHDLRKMNCPEIAGHILFFLSFVLPSHTEMSSYKLKIQLTHTHLLSQTD